jgi:hypothetical protein
MSADDFTPNLALPYVLPNQAQKHVTVNESLAAVDGLLMASVVGIGLNDAPSDPIAGQAWITGGAPQGVWSDSAGKLAVWRDGTWHFYTPIEGWRIWDRSEKRFVVFDGTNWLPVSASTQNIAYMGIDSVADDANPFSARLNAALFMSLEDTDGGTGDIRLSLNKQNDANTGSIVFKDGWTGRAEFYLVGSADLQLRVSSDGAVWESGLTISNATGNSAFGGIPGTGDKLSVHGNMRVQSSDGFFRLLSNGTLDMSRNGGGSIYLRGRSSGSNVAFGATNSAGQTHSTVLMIRPDEEDIVAAYAISPSSSGAVDLGKSNAVWRDAYLQNAPVISSDRRGKIEIDDLERAETLIEYLRPVSYRRHPEGKMHFGFIAQEVKRALDAVGLSSSALWNLSDETDAESLQAIRQEELISVLVSAVQRLQARVDHLETACTGGG